MNRNEKLLALVQGENNYLNTKIVTQALITLFLLVYVYT